MHRTVDFRTPGVEFLPLRVEFWLLGLFFGLFGVYIDPLAVDFLFLGVHLGPTLVNFGV